MNEPFSWLTVFSKLGVPGTAILAVVLGIAGAVGTNVGNVRERATAFLDYQHNEIHYHNGDGNTITNASSVLQVHEHPEIDGRLDGVEGRLANLEQGQVAIYGRLDKVDGRLTYLEERFTNLEQGQADIKATLQKLLEKP